MHQPGMRDIALTAHGAPELAVIEFQGVDSPHVDWHVPAEFGQQVGSHGSPPAQRFVDHRGRRGNVTGVQMAGIGYPVGDGACRRRPAIPHQPVEVGDVDQKDVAAVGQRMAAVGRVWPRCVVFHIDGGDIDARPPAQPLLGEFEFCGPLQHDQVDVLGAQLADRNLLRRIPIASAQPASVGVAGLVDRDQVPVPSRHERLHPGSVYVPRKDRSRGC